MKWETQAGMPTKGLTYKLIIEKLTELQEHTAMMGHLTADEDKAVSHGWLRISETIKRTQDVITSLAVKGRLN